MAYNLSDAELLDALREKVHIINRARARQRALLARVRRRKRRMAEDDIDGRTFRELGELIDRMEA